MKKIAFKCTSVKDAEIIDILISLGGNNPRDYSGNSINCYYFINENNNIDFSSYPPRGYKSYTLKEYKQLNNMKKRSVQINLTTAKEWYNKGGDLKEIALQAFSKEELQSLSKSWKEYCEINPYLDKDKAVFLLADGNINLLSSSYCARINLPGAVPSKERAEQFLTLNKLLQIRDYYNQGWEPNWKDDFEEKYCITTHRNNLNTITSWYTNYLFAFKTRELRGEFLQNFEPDLEKIKEFL